ncbi:MAG: NAD(P)H-dependent amine dehydrogenase family protein [Solirubrobacteraceae bacterium]
MRRIKAVVYGVGSMGSVATRMMLEKGVDIVGALARSPEKVGRDLGDVAGLGFETGVIIEDDPDRVLSSRQVDIAVIAVASYMSDMYEHLRRCAEHGVNAVTISEEALYPWNTSPMATAELDRLARRHGVTLTGTGHQDVYWVNLVSMVLATAHRIDGVTGRASWNVDDFGPEVAKDQRVDTSVEDFDRWLAEAHRPPSFGRNTLGALVEALGLSVAAQESTTRPEVAKQPVASKSLGITVDTGRVIGFTDVDTVRSNEGITLTFEMTGRLYLEGEADINDWTVAGEPELRLLNPAVPPGVTTCTQLVNRIPDVINAPPGFVTIEKLPPLRYRTFPLGMYVRDGA